MKADTYYILEFNKQIPLLTEIFIMQIRNKTIKLLTPKTLKAYIFAELHR
jgi:hypothetical protein